MRLDTARPGSVFRTEMETRTSEDGSQELVVVEQFVAVDGEWIDVHELIDAWRRTRPEAIQTNEGVRYLHALRAS